MRALLVGPWEDLLNTAGGDVEIRRVGSVEEAAASLEEWHPHLTFVAPAIAGEDRNRLISAAESVGSRMIAVETAEIRIPGSSLQDLEKHAIVETLKSVDGSTTRAAKILGISVRKIQYRLREWRSQSSNAPTQGAEDAVH